MAQNLERDLAAARLTQQSLIPQKPPHASRLGNRRLLPAGHPSGRRYLWLAAHEGRTTLFWIADATGHGASAALLTTLAKLLFHHGSVEHDAPAEIMEAVNNDFRSIFGARSFMTAMCVALDPEDRPRQRGGRGPSAASDRAKRTGRPNRSHPSAPPLGLVERSAVR